MKIMKKMNKKEFDYYIFIDYSENLIGYSIIDKNKLKELIPKITRFRHYRKTKDRKLYLKYIKNALKRENILNYLLKLKIRKVIDSPEIYADIAVFLKKYHNCIIFISVDDKQYSNFERFVEVIDGKNTKVVKESELKEGSNEYKLSLILDNLLNMERLKK